MRSWGWPPTGIEAVPRGDVGDLFADELPVGVTFTIGQACSHVESTGRQLVGILPPFDAVGNVKPAAVVGKYAVDGAVARRNQIGLRAPPRCIRTRRKEQRRPFQPCVG